MLGAANPRCHTTPCSLHSTKGVTRVIGQPVFWSPPFPWLQEWSVAHWLGDRIRQVYVLAGRDHPTAIPAQHRQLCSVGRVEEVRLDVITNGVSAHFTIKKVYTIKKKKRERSVQQCRGQCPVHSSNFISPICLSLFQDLCFALEHRTCDWETSHAGVLILYLWSTQCMSYLYERCTTNIVYYHYIIIIGHYWKQSHLQLGGSH